MHFDLKSQTTKTITIIIKVNKLMMKPKMCIMEVRIQERKEVTPHSRTHRRQVQYNAVPESHIIKALEIETDQVKNLAVYHYYCTNFEYFVAEKASITAFSYLVLISLFSGHVD